MNEENIQLDAASDLAGNAAQQNTAENPQPDLLLGAAKSESTENGKDVSQIAQESNVLFAQYLKTIAETERLKAQLEMAKQAADPMQLLKNPDNIKLVAQDEAVKKAVIENYLLKVAGGGAVEVMSPGKGDGKTVAQFKSPKTLKEAARMASYLFEN